MNVSLTPEHEKFVQKKLSSGMYASASEIIREGLRLLQEQDQLRELRFDGLRKEIQKGIDDAQAGRLVDGPAAMKKLKARARRR